MEATRRTVLQGAALGVLGMLGLAACTSGESGQPLGGTASETGTGTSPALVLDGGVWQYDATNNVYYQLRKAYVATPQAAHDETLGIYVPGAYFTGTKNADGSYAVTLNKAGTVAGFTAATAPIVMPVNTPGYAAQKPPTSYAYDAVSAYLKAGFVYVAAGLRGKDSHGDGYTGNAPWGVTDLKAAVRYLRFNAGRIAGSTDRIFVFGHSGGGAQSSVMGASGDSPLYTPYLTKIGAAMSDAKGAKLSDAVAGVMAWCPITNLDDANAAYEWNMGQFAATDSRAPGTWTAQYSKDLAAACAQRLNALGLKDAAGRALTLEKSSSGIYLAGSYHDHLMAVVQGSLNDFLAATTFPYTPTTTQLPGMGGGPGAAGSETTAATTYATVQDYIDDLNTDSTWVDYDDATKKATVTSLGGFVASQKSASKDVGAFDGVDRSATENLVLGVGTLGLHFSTVSRDVIKANADAYAKLTGWSSDLGLAEYESDFAKTDGVGKDVAWRTRMYDPMYYLASTAEGYTKSTVAPHWRIRTGIQQGDTASTVEVNLALALDALGVKNVDFATVWGQGHTMAELTGSPTDNFIAWVKKAAA